MGRINLGHFYLGQLVQSGPMRTLGQNGPDIKIKIIIINNNFFILSK